MIKPNWPAPTWVNAITTTQAYADQRVAFNRLRVRQRLNLTKDWVWLDQIHGTDVVQLTAQTPEQAIKADGCWTQDRHTPCAITTADCLPLLLCDTQGSVVAAVHAGWRGLASGIIENAVQALKAQTQNGIMAWLGPAIGPDNFEVGEEVRNCFIEQDLRASTAFVRGQKPGKWFGSLYELARIRLQNIGIHQIYGGQYCTYRDDTQLYSYRRENIGRMTTIIWLG